MKRSLVWYIPSFHGDIRLEAVDANSTRLETQKLTASEVDALGFLRKAAIKMPVFGEPWAKAEDFSDPNTWKFTDTRSILLAAPIEKVQALLARALKPGKSLLAAVRFSDGKIEEAWRAPPTSPYREPAAAEPPALPEKTVEAAAPPPVPEKAIVAATVAAPIRGCPAPDFDEAEVRASRVLCSFLTPEQIEDWNTRGQFISTGLDTGSRYLLTSRERPARLAKTGGRSLFDVTSGTPICTHDWDVPAAEELLSLHLHLAVPNGELYLIRGVHDL